MSTEFVLGWDIGGAHLKVAAIDGGGRFAGALQLPCPLWQGLQHLDRAMGEVLRSAPIARLHAVTMTGELADIFRNRAQGVKILIARLGKHLPAARTWVYAGSPGFLTPERASIRPETVASVNWAASAQLVANRMPEAIFVDIGSTTTDIVPIRSGELRNRGWTDAQRLACEELVYTGVVRTPIVAIAHRLPYYGEWIAPMAEHFATTADVYRLTGELPDGADQLPAADNTGKTARDSARRLARMFGLDFESAPLAYWKHCAHYLADMQLWKINQACQRVLSRGDVFDRAPIVGAGTGRFLARKLAAQLERRYRDFSSLVPAAPASAAWAANCAPAVAVALLLHVERSKRSRGVGRQARR